MNSIKKEMRFTSTLHAELFKAVTKEQKQIETEIFISRILLAIIFFMLIYISC